MSPILTLVLATTLSSAEPTREHAQIIAAAVELQASLERASVTATASADPVDISLRYDFAKGVELASIPPVSPDPRAIVTYSLSTPVFRDLL